MASRQYEMLFKLGARLGENFKGTFNSAQRVLAETQKRLQAMQKQQSDIESYQKLQKGVERTTSRLEMYREQLRNVEGICEQTAVQMQSLKTNSLLSISE